MTGHIGLVTGVEEHKRAKDRRVKASEVRDVLSQVNEIGYSWRRAVGSEFEANHFLKSRVEERLLYCKYKVFYLWLVESIS